MNATTPAQPAGHLAEDTAPPPAASLSAGGPPAAVPEPPDVPDAAPPDFVAGADFPQRMRAVVQVALRRAALEPQWGAVEICLARTETWLAPSGMVRMGAIRHPLLQDQTVRPEQIGKAMALIFLYLRQVLQAPVALPEDLRGQIQPELEEIVLDQVLLIRFMEEVERSLHAAEARLLPKAPAPVRAASGRAAAPAEERRRFVDWLRQAARQPATYVGLSFMLTMVGSWGYLLFHSEAASLRPSRFADVAAVKEAQIETESLRLVLSDNSFDALPPNEQAQMAADLLARAGQPIRVAVIQTATARYMVQHLEDGKTFISNVSPLAPQASP